MKNKDDLQNNWPLWLQKFPEGAGQQGTEQVSRELFTGREFTWDLAGWLEFGEAGKQMHKILRFPNYDPHIYNMSCLKSILNQEWSKIE